VHGGGAQITETGKTVLAAYRALEAKLAATSGAADELASLSAMLAPMAEQSA
jgi:molybdenum-dependent DNA-binding transcriptional regulator ModE